MQDLKRVVLWAGSGLLAGGALMWAYLRDRSRQGTPPPQPSQPSPAQPPCAPPAVTGLRWQWVMLRVPPVPPPIRPAVVPPPEPRLQGIATWDAAPDKACGLDFSHYVVELDGRTLTLTPFPSALIFGARPGQRLSVYGVWGQKTGPFTVVEMLRGPAASIVIPPHPGGVIMPAA